LREIGELKLFDFLPGARCNIQCVQFNFFLPSLEPVI
jgi:hypothetical protein